MGEQRLAKLKFVMDMRSRQFIDYFAFTLPHMRVFLACLFIPFIAWWQMQPDDD